MTASDAPTPCQNCAHPDSDPLSYDLDLPTVHLCRLCSLTIVADPALFEDMGRHRRTR